MLTEGMVPVVLDNLVNAKKESLKRVEEITGKPVKFVEIDLLDVAALKTLFDENEFSAVIHFAGLKAVGESCKLPLKYYHNNITGTINLLQTMQDHGCKNLVFSSSATVYGDPKYNPIDENHPVGGCTNPYGKTKYFIEEICRDFAASDPDWNIVLLRYFNPIGAHASGRIGEDPQGIPNNLVPYVSQVAVGRRAELGVFGNDYDTVDGTGVRDYIHVVDLALGHVAALRRLTEKPGCCVYNLGSGNGNSVLQVVEAFKKASGKPIPYAIKDRRPGDIGTCYANADKALKELKWKTTRDIDEMCADGWRWQSANPNGYE
jgi:UDP-glucose 4-epimerase